MTNSEGDRGPGTIPPSPLPMEDPDLDPDACDGYMVLVHDQQLDEVDSYGPFDRTGGEEEVARRRRVVDADGVDDITVGLARFHAVPR